MQNQLKDRRPSGQFISKYGTLLFWAAALALAVIVPIAFRSRYMFRIMTMIMIYTILALSLNLISGYLGQISLGHAGFYAIGAYTGALLSVDLHVNFFLGALAAMVLTGIVATFLGFSTARISGAYLAITTLGFAELVKVILKNWESLTYGTYGVQNIPRPSIFCLELSNSNGGIYILSVLSLVFVLLFSYTLEHSKFGRSLRAMREDPTAASLMGVNNTGCKVLAFALSGVVAGYAGTLYAHLNGYIDPSIFTQDASMLILSIVILGGMGSIKGMVVGAVLLVSFPEVLRSFSEYRFVVYGLLLIAMMRFRPQGILGGLSRKPYALPKGVTYEERGEH